MSLNTLSKADKKKLIRNIAKQSAEALIKKLDEGKIPEGWDGIEFRWWLAQDIDWGIAGNSGAKRRKKSFKKDMIVNGL